MPCSFKNTPNAIFTDVSMNLRRCFRDARCVLDKTRLLLEHGCWRAAGSAGRTFCMLLPVEGSAHPRFYLTKDTLLCICLA